MPKNLVLILFAVILAFTTACSQPKELVYKGVKNFSLKKASLAEPVIGLDLQFYNPNKHGVKIKHGEVEVFINNKHVGTAMLTDAYTVPKLDSFSVPVSLAIDMSKILPNALQLLLNNTVDIRLEGHIKVKRGFIYINIPVNYEGKQELNL